MTHQGYFLDPTTCIGSRRASEPVTPRLLLAFNSVGSDSIKIDSLGVIPRPVPASAGKILTVVPSTDVVTRPAKEVPAEVSVIAAAILVAIVAAVGVSDIYVISVVP